MIEGIIGCAVLIGVIVTVTRALWPVVQPEPPKTPEETLRDNYLCGAIDVVTFELALEDLANGIPNSYACASYERGSDGNAEDYGLYEPKDHTYGHDRTPDPEAPAPQVGPDRLGGGVDTP